MKSTISKSSMTKVGLFYPLPHQLYNTSNYSYSISDTKEEDLTHPEDIAHFKKHDEMDAAAEYQERIDAMPIVEQNIPQKFRRY